MDYVEILLYILIMSFAPGVILFVLFNSLRKGLIVRDKMIWELDFQNSGFCLANDKKRIEVVFSDIHSAYLASNGNWCESTIVEDALSLWDENGKKLAKIPRSANGFDDLVARLKENGVEVKFNEVEGPRYLD